MHNKVKQIVDKGFTLIELLVVISIISLLASVVLSSLNSARADALDTQRISDIDQINKALELYYLENDSYPAVNEARSYESRWDTLATELEPYIDPLPIDPDNRTSGVTYYMYDADSGNNFQNYGLMVVNAHTLTDRMDNLSNTDGGYSNSWYETGPQVNYCLENYSGGNSNWVHGGSTVVCVGGN